MNSSTIDDPFATFPAFPSGDDELFQERLTLRTDGFGTDLAFARQINLPAHDQGVLARSCVIFIGAGGINSWASDGHVRAGGRKVTVCDYDVVDGSNITRQLYSRNDCGRRKVFALAERLVADAPGPCEVTALALPFEQVVREHADVLDDADVLVVGVDNNPCRLAATKLGIDRGIPVIFAMISPDGQRIQGFLAEPGKACLWCAKPTLDPELRMPCVPAVVTSCFVAAAIETFLLHRVLMGWPVNHPRFNWREADLMGILPDRVGTVERRPNCRVCSGGADL